MANKLLNTIYPIIFENDNDEDYCFYGTISLVGYLNEIFAITAKHCFKYNKFDDIRIFPNNVKNIYSLPIKKVFDIENILKPIIEDDDTDCKDLLILHIDRQLLDLDTINNLSVFDLNKYKSLSADILINSEMFIFGFPQEHQFVDRVNKIIKSRLIVINAKYVEESNCKFISIIKLINSSVPLSNLNYMSGSPVISKNQNNYYFTGILIRGNNFEAPARYLDLSVIYNAIKKAL